jgi:hypothetical protein
MLPITYEQLGERFLRYAHRVRSLTINGDKMVHTFDPPGTHQWTRRQVSPRVASLWAAHGSLLVFPRLQRLVVRPPPFGDPWNLQIVLDLISHRPSFADFEIGNNDDHMGFYGKDLRMSTPLTGGLSLISLPTLLFNELFRAVLASTQRIDWMYIESCITAEAIPLLALLPSLTSLSVASGQSLPVLQVVPHIPSGGFRHLELLNLQENCDGSKIFVWNLFLAMEPNKKLSELSYHYCASGEPDAVRQEFPLFADLARFIQHTGMWTTLTSLEFSIAFDAITSEVHHSSIEESRRLFAHMHSLRAITRIHISTNIHLPVTADIVGDLLRSCPALYRWFLEFDSFDNVSEPISFVELHHAVQDHGIGRLPVRLRCDTVPLPDDIHKFTPLLLDSLSVHDVGDPTTLGSALVEVFPNLDNICVENSTNNDPCYDEDIRKARIAMEVMATLRSASSGVLGSTVTRAG